MGLGRQSQIDPFFRVNPWGGKIAFYGSSVILALAIALVPVKLATGEIDLCSTQETDPGP